MQFCAGAEGCVFTVTTYAAPPPSWLAKVNAPAAETAARSPALVCSTSPEPVSPVTVPPIEYVAGDGGGLEAPPPPHPTMSRARNVTDPIERNMMIPLQRFCRWESFVAQSTGACMKPG